MTPGRGYLFLWSYCFHVGMNYQANYRQKSHVKQDVFLIIFFSFCSLLLYFVPTGFEERIQKDSVRSRGRIVKVDNADILQTGIVKQGVQALTVKLLDGPYAGTEVSATNLMLGKMEIDKMFAEGDIALMVLSLKDGELYFANAQDHYRLHTEFYLLLCFAALLIAFAGITGLKALFSFVFTALMIWKVMVPLFLKDVDPILVSLGVVTILTAAIIFLVGGLTKRGFVSFLGSLLGILLTMFMAIIFSKGFYLHGIRPFSETLLYSGFPHLDLTRLFLAGIFIASSGAVMDLSMDVASGMYELVLRKPDIHFMDALRADLALAGQWLAR